MRVKAGLFISIMLAGVAVLSAACSDASGPSGGKGGGPIGAIRVGSGIQFVSAHNGSANPAVDTIPAGTAVTWTWSGSLAHSVRSVGTPAFASSGTKTGSGTYVVTFTVPGTYQYDCAVHGSAMTGTIVVQ